MRKFITEGEGLPKWTTPISHAVVVNGTCYLSGQLSVSETGEYISGTPREEAGRALGNLISAARAAGFALEDIVFIDITFADLTDLPQVNEVYANLFPQGRRPARTISQAAALPYGGKVKVVGVAVKDANSRSLATNEA